MLTQDIKPHFIRGSQFTVEYIIHMISV